MYLPAEWERQRFVQLTMPHKESDWSPYLDEVAECYYKMIAAISQYEPVLLVADDMEYAHRVISDLPNVDIVGCKTNDTWARDHGFITTKDSCGLVFNDFQFNGWGLKFASDKDNQINRQIWASGILQGSYANHLDFVLEGGSIESDGRGTILTTSSCLLAENRNNIYSKSEIEEKLCEYLGSDRVLWLDHGYLAGDDTDGHIDTLARFCDAKTIAYVSCDDPSDEHFEELAKMKDELMSFTTKDGLPYRLIALPLPSAIYDGEDRLPATYANFLIINGAVIYPTYGQSENDRIAKEILEEVFPGRDVIGVDCRVLIRQHGSLHCCTMQYPAESLNSKKTYSKMSIDTYSKKH